MIKGRRELSDEDRVLWSLVARHVKPLRGPAITPPLPEPAPPAAAPPGPQPVPAVRPVPLPRPPAASAHLDRPTHDKLAKGRVPIEGRVDLHGLYQDEAHGLLLDFLRRAHAKGARHVLVITGKGPGGDGILRRAVPGWLSTAPFRELVSAHDHAARGHGGTGALYLRLKRRG